MPIPFLPLNSIELISTVAAPDCETPTPASWRTMRSTSTVELGEI